MYNNFKKYLGLPWSVTFIFGLLLVTFFVFSPTYDLPDHEPLLTPSENTSYQPYSKHPQFELIINLQKAFIQNAKDIGPSVVNVSKVHEVTEYSKSYHTPSGEKQTLFFYLKSWFNKNLREKNFYEMSLCLPRLSQD